MSRWNKHPSPPQTEPEHQAAPRSTQTEDSARLVETCVELADTLSAEFDLIEFLYTLVERCVELLDVSAVGLMLGDDRGRLRVLASSTEETRLLELFELQNEQGPCLECYRSGQAVDEPDLATAQQRWPLFAPEALRTGLRAVHALPMRLHAQPVGALNLFHRNPAGLRESDTRIAQGLLDVATIGLVQVQLGHRREMLLDQLRTAIDARTAIEQAKGILAQKRHITPTEAFTVLRGHARQHHHRLTQLAYAVIDGEPAAAELLNSTEGLLHGR
jgi:ANTAR domain-containing protein/GAF domain-containing protein